MSTVSVTVARPNTKPISARVAPSSASIGSRNTLKAEGVERAERQIDARRGEECGGGAVVWAHGVCIMDTDFGRGAKTSGAWKATDVEVWCLRGSIAVQTRYRFVPDFRIAARHCTGT